MKKLILLLILIPSLVFGSIPDLAFKNAESFFNVREATGKNDGPQIEQWLGYIGLRKGDPYCAAMAIWCYHIAAVSEGQKDVLPKIGRSAGLLSYAKKNPFKYQVVSPNQIIFGAVILSKGDIAIFQHGTAIGSDFPGHTELVNEQLTTAFFSSIGGNTGATSSGNQAEGEGVYRKKRKINASGFPVRGFIRIK